MLWSDQAIVNGITAVPVMCLMMLMASNRKVMGATAVRSVFGKDVPVLKNRGCWMPSLFSRKTLITIHPSSILRAPDPAARERAYAGFVADLRMLAKAVA